MARKSEKLKQDGRDRGRNKMGIEPVEYAAVSGQDRSGILDARLALQRALEQVPHRTEDRHHNS